MKNSKSALGARQRKGCKPDMALVHRRTLCTRTRDQPQPRTSRQDQPPFFDGDSLKWVVPDEQVAIQVNVVNERCQVRRGGNRHRARDHAAEQDLESMRARDMNHAQRREDAATLVELDDHAVVKTGKLRNGFGMQAGLICEQRQRAAFVQPYTDAGTTSREQLDQLVRPRIPALQRCVEVFDPLPEKVEIFVYAREPALCFLYVGETNMPFMCCRTALADLRLPPDVRQYNVWFEVRRSP